MTRNDANYDAEIAAGACAWLAQIESGDLSTADRAALKEWMATSPRHAEEIRAVAALSAELAALTELSEPLAAQLETRRRRRPALGMAAALAAALLAVVGAGIFSLFLRTPAIPEFYATEIGEYRTVDLDDGSSIKLNTNSAVEVTYGKTARKVRLAKGEAFFTVEKDKARPFIVYAGSNYARAIGTAFSVRLLNDKTELIVTEGVVEFSKIASTPATAAEPDDNAPTDADQSRPVLVEAGYELLSNAAAREEEALRLSDAARKRKLSWIEGLFDFSETPLSEVVSEVSRHTALRIEIEDPALKDVKFGGVFR
ncbi:MAG: FecR domain-containing protein, partial [Amphiplicatus sp.]